MLGEDDNVANRLAGNSCITRSLRFYSPKRRIDAPFANFAHKVNVKAEEFCGF